LAGDQARAEGAVHHRLCRNAVLNHGHLDHGMHVLTKLFQMDHVARKVRDLISNG
jgi:hypothetical protein